MLYTILPSFIMEELILLRSLPQSHYTKMKTPPKKA